MWSTNTQYLASRNPNSIQLHQNNDLSQPPTIGVPRPAMSRCIKCNTFAWTSEKKGICSNCHFQEAKTQCEHSNHLTAITNCDQAIELEPENAEAWLYRGMAKFLISSPGALNDLKQAVQLVQLELDPNKVKFFQSKLDIVQEAIKEENERLFSYKNKQ
jgi:hypothetical protein